MHPASIIQDHYSELLLLMLLRQVPALRREARQERAAFVVGRLRDIAQGNEPTLAELSTLDLTPSSLRGLLQVRGRGQTPLKASGFGPDPL